LVQPTTQLGPNPKAPVSAPATTSTASPEPCDRAQDANSRSVWIVCPLLCSRFRGRPR
jgi:hypothetical protein